MIRRHSAVSGERTVPLGLMGHQVPWEYGRSNTTELCRKQTENESPGRSECHRDDMFCCRQRLPHPVAVCS